MIYLYSFLGLILMLLAYARFEAAWLEIKRVKHSNDKNALKVLHLSDIHIGRLKVSYESIRKVIELEKPDLIILSGDYFENKAHIPRFLCFLDYIKGSFEKHIFFCLGNHDYETFLEDKSLQEDFLRDMTLRGCIPLHNKSICIEKNSKKYNIIGIADMRYNMHRVDDALKDRIRYAHASLAFSHNPDIIFEIPENTVDYLFCGHFHGGQIWAPFNFEFAVLRHEKLCRMGITRGLHKVNGISLYINRGLGNVVFPLRFFSRPEITIYYLP